MWHAARRGRLVGFGLAVLGALMVLLLPGALRADDSTIYFGATGHILNDDHGFLGFYRAHNGERMLGYAISEPLVENGLTVQYFERGRMEKHVGPEGVSVLLGRVGVEYERAFNRLFARVVFSVLPRDTDLFVETGHSLGGPYRLFWYNNNGMAMLGLPISEPLLQRFGPKLVRVQYFERGRLEYHPELAGTPEEISIGLLGSELAPRHDINTAAVPAPTPIPTPEPPRGDLGLKHIIVNLSEQHLYAYEGETLVFDTAVSTGRDGFDTPPGEFSIYSKLDVQTMEGTISDEYYLVPDVPNVMYIYGGVALHGTYWHDMFGVARMSHGCVNLPLWAAEWVYGWAPLNTPVTVTY
jgi:hypothetical protein